MPGDGLFLGEVVDPATHARTGEAVRLDPADLTTHGVIVGMTGSGKTGLGIVLLEEALLAGVPVLAIDPKGDLANLALVFPALDGASFAPWVEAGDDADAIATSWREGLATWGLDGARLTALREAASVTVYTPGSTAGVPLNLIGAIRRPPAGTDEETAAEELSGTVSGLLGLVGIESDPLSTPEHILLANLVHHAWSGGEDIDLAGLVGRVLTPSIRKLGVLDIDEFIPEKERKALATRLNGLLASPTAAAWSAGVVPDIDALLRPEGPDGRPGAAVVSLAHLGDEERQFVVARLLGELVTWMRRQPGTDQLRVLLYFDEVLGFVPPVANPPAKPSLLRIFKQGRAFGVGAVLATQNPVDLDYKALANAGTWAIGRLQTEQDKKRLLDGMAAAAGGVDIGAVSDTITALGKREFVLRQASEDQPVPFTTRWAMSYLRGPLTRDQLTRLPRPPWAEPTPTPTPTAPPTPTSAPPPPPTPTSAPPPTSPTDATGVRVAHGTVGQAHTGPVVATAPVGQAHTGPVVDAGVAVRWLAPAAPWAAAIGAVPTGTRYELALALRGVLTYDDRALEGGAHREEFEAVVLPIGTGFDPVALHVVDHDDRDLLVEAPASAVAATYVEPAGGLPTKTLVEKLRRSVVDHLVAARPLTVSVNRELKLASRPAETAEAFAMRCAVAADERADRDAAELRRRYQARLRREADQIDTAAQRVARAESAVNASRSDELVEGSGSLLGALFGGRRRSRSLIRSVSQAADRRRRSEVAAERMETSRARLAQEQGDVAALEAELAAELSAVVARWDGAAATVETLPIPLERSDVSIAAVCLLWVPTA